MAMPYATVADLRDLWPDLPVDREAEAGVKLNLASVKVRALYPYTDSKIVAGTLDPAAVAMIVTEMVYTAMNVSPALENVASANEQAGPFGRQLTYTNTDGKLYLTADHKRILRGRLDTGVPFTIYT